MRQIFLTSKALPPCWLSCSIQKSVSRTTENCCGLAASKMWHEPTERKRHTHHRTKQWRVMLRSPSWQKYMYCFVLLCTALYCCVQLYTGISKGSDVNRTFTKCCVIVKMAQVLSADLMSSIAVLLQKKKRLFERRHQWQRQQQQKTTRKKWKKTRKENKKKKWIKMRKKNTNMSITHHKSCSHKAGRKASERH